MDPEQYLQSVERDRQNFSFPIDNELKKRKEFSDREVGLTHPDLSSFIRLNDHGDIEIFVGPEVGIVISAKSKSISMFADNIKLFCKEDGLRWNTYSFNYSASNFIEPTLIPINLKSLYSTQNGVSHYLDRINELDKEEEQKTITISGEYGFNSQPEYIEQKYVQENDLSDLSFEDIGLLEAYSSDYSVEHINLMIKFLKDGLNFDQAHEKALREINE